MLLLWHFFFLIDWKRNTSNGKSLQTLRLKLSMNNLRERFFDSSPVSAVPSVVCNPEHSSFQLNTVQRGNSPILLLQKHSHILTSPFICSSSSSSSSPLSSSDTSPSSASASMFAGSFFPWKGLQCQFFSTIWLKKIVLPTLHSVFHDKSNILPHLDKHFPFQNIWWWQTPGLIRIYIWQVQLVL